MSQRIRWLRRELDRWVESSLITPEQSESIRRLYPEPKAGLPWVVILFGGLGAVVFGLGVILLFAYNWEAMPKAAKLGTIFTALVAAHATGIALHRRERLRPLGEAFCVLGTMLFGAGIWLVAQIYNIQEHFPNGFLFWALGAVAVAWAMRSISQGILATVLFTVWTVVEVAEFETPLHAGPLVIVALLGTLAWFQRSRVLLAFVLPAVGISSAAVAAVYHGELAFTVLFALAALLIAVARLVPRWRAFPESAPVIHVLGYATYFVLLYLLTFPDVAEDVLSFGLYGGDESRAPGYVYWITPVALAILAWAGVAWSRVWGRSRPTWQELRELRIDLFLVPLALIASQFFALASFVSWDVSIWWFAGLANLIFLGHSVDRMARGCLEGRLHLTVIGSLLFAALAVARYFDLFDSFLLRGLVFLIVGGALIAEGVFYTRLRRARETEGETA